MAEGQDREALGGLAPGLLRPDEVVAHHWAAPGGRGVLTNLRCLLVSHPHPIHRQLLWSVDLEKIDRLEVEEFGPRDGPPQVAVQGTFGGGGVGATDEDLSWAVIVDATTVLEGDPGPCADLQRRLDDARTARCLALYGRLLPYRPATAPPRGGPGEETEAGTPSTGPPTAAPADSFLLFVAGEPFKDGVPDGASPLLVGVMVGGGPMLVEQLGGHERADFLPGQIYGRQAEVGRMVLDLARKCSVAVKVIDVDHTGADAPLAERYATADVDLPLLVRPDGLRLSGEDSFVPSRVAEFLQGR